jgi:hypothetical protein
MKHYLEQATGVSLKNLQRCAKQMSGTLVKTKNHSKQGQPKQCRINSRALHLITADSEVWFGYRIYPNNGDSTDPYRSVQKKMGHICFEEHFVVRTKQGEFICATPGEDVVPDYEFWFVAVGPADPLSKDFKGNYEYTHNSGLDQSPYKIVLETA